ncbi:MAG: hypothetical protein RR620_10140 [Clostridium sp.]
MGRQVMRNNKEIKQIKENIFILKIELEEKYNDYYTAEIGYEYSRDRFGKSIESCRILDEKQSLLSDINYLNDRITILQDKVSLLRYAMYEDTHKILATIF